MALPIEFYVYVGYGLFAMVAVTASLAFLQGGFLRPFMEVKRSRGGKILVRVRHPVQDYFRAGAIDEGFLCYKDREKNNRRIPMRPGVVSRAATVFWVEVDDEKNCFYDRASGAAIETNDPVKVDNLLVRALMRPGIFGDQMVKLIVILIFVAIVAILGVAFLTYKNGTALTLLQESIKNLNIGVVQ